ncbi:MAG TPA: acyloxyacyl hydrolase [Terracidiphilus sp.]
MLTILGAQASAQAKTESPFYARRNTFGVFVGYSPDSSPILLGNAENRKLVNIGVSYSRRLFMNRVVNWQYDGELLPVVLESDPTAELEANQTSPTVATFTMPYGPVLDCTPQSAQYVVTLSDGVTYSGTETVFCSGRRWTVGEGMSPAGFQWNFVPRRRLQPLFVGHGGYMYSSKPIPIADGGSFNFTFDLGVGLEFYQSRTRSWRGEFRYHHISNHDTATENPGIDNLLYQVTYAFGH